MRYSIVDGDDPNFVYIMDSRKNIIFSRSNIHARSHVEELLRLANKSDSMDEIAMEKDKHDER